MKPIKLIAPALLPTVLASCSLLGYQVSIEKKDKPVEPTQVEITFTADKHMNPNGKGRPSPLIVRLYALKEYRAFVKEDFFDLDANDQGLLGPDLTFRDELVFEPGENRTYTKKLDDATGYFGFIARYIDINNAKWRDAVEIEANTSNKIVVRLDEKSIDAEKPEQEGLPSFDEMKKGVNSAHDTISDVEKKKDAVKGTVDKVLDIPGKLKW